MIFIVTLVSSVVFHTRFECSFLCSDLFDYISERGCKFSEVEARYIMLQLVEAVHYLHSNGNLHSFRV